MEINAEAEAEARRIILAVTMHDRDALDSTLDQVACPRTRELVRSLGMLAASLLRTRFNSRAATQQFALEDVAYWLDRAASGTDR